MAVAVDLGWPSLPNKAETLAGLPVLGETDARIAGALNHLGFVRARQRVTHAEEHFIQPGAVPEASELTRFTFTPRPEATHVVIAIEYVAPGNQKGSGGAPNPATITATLFQMGGVVVDIGCEWREDDGTLPVGGAGLVGETQTVTTGDVPNDFEAGAGPLRSAPRALSLEGANGQTLEVVISAQWCAVTTVSVWEVPVGLVE